jgi:EpsI family protein
VGGWTAGAPDSSPGRWEPAFQNASVVAEQRYSQGAAGGGSQAEVAVWVGYYRDQNYERKLVTSTNGLTEAKPDPLWAQVSGGSTSVAVGGDNISFRTAVLRGAVDPSALGAPRRRVWQLYWVGGALTTSDARAKLRLAADRLLGRGDDGAVVLISTPMAPQALPESADNLLRAFVQTHFAAVRQALDATHAKR